jgi:hypothetical protein
MSSNQQFSSRSGYQSIDKHWSGTLVEPDFMRWDPPIGFMLSSILTARICFFDVAVGWWYVLHTLTSSQQVSKATRLSRLCVTFLGNWTVFLTDWITGVGCKVLEASILIASMENEAAPITVAVWHPRGYKYLNCSPPRTISHSFPWFALGFPLSCTLLTINGGPKRY